MPNPYEAKGPVRRANQSSGARSATAPDAAPEPVHAGGLPDWPAAHEFLPFPQTPEDRLHYSAAYAQENGMPSGPVPAVVGWVGRNWARADAALTVERAKAEPQQRRSLLRALEELTAELAS